MTDSPMTALNKQELREAAENATAGQWVVGGTAGVACQQTGRDFIGIEKDATIFQTACQRMGIKQEYAA